MWHLLGMPQTLFFIGWRHSGAHSGAPSGRGCPGGPRAHARAGLDAPPTRKGWLENRLPCRIAAPKSFRPMSLIFWAHGARVGGLVARLRCKLSPGRVGGGRVVYWYCRFHRCAHASPTVRLYFNQLLLPPVLLLLPLRLLRLVRRQRLVRLVPVLPPLLRLLLGLLQPLLSLSALHFSSELRCCGLS